jgi:8-oxo-dGTP pyrophosphatase MutT (NUDIX family)
MKPTPTCGTVRKLTDQRHLNLFTLDVHHEKEVRPWVFASRRANPSPGAGTPHGGDAVFVIALIERAGETCLLIIREFRPVLGAHELSLPAGIIDPGEDAATAAARELWEETGLRLNRVTHVSPPVASSAGLTDETVVYVYGEAEGTLSTQHLEAHEHIDARLVNLAELQALLADPGANVFSGRFYAIAMGFVAAGRFALPALANRNVGGDGYTTLYRPVGPKELALIRESGFRAFPPRLLGQPIFYPVLNEAYAAEIAREWNVRESGAGYVTRFRVPCSIAAGYQRQVVGAKRHEELWVPAEELAEFNRHIEGLIEVVAEFPDAPQA